MNKITDFDRPTLLRLLFLAAAIVLIFIFIPGQKQTSYSYEVNKLWNYDDLIAPFDIPINIDADRRAAITDSLNANFQPVYYRDASIAEDVISHYDEQLRQRGLNAIERTRLIDALRRIYRTGIINSGDSLHMLRMVSPSDHTSKSYSVSDYYTPRGAYIRIDSIANAEHLKSGLASGLSLSLRPNILLDSVETERFRREDAQRALAPIGMLPQGEVIVSRSERITPQTFTNIATYQQMVRERGDNINSRHTYPKLGMMLIITLLILIMYVYTAIYRPQLYSEPRMMLFLLSVIVCFTIFAFVLTSAFTHGIYIVPFTIIPIVVLVFVDSRTAFFTYMVTILLVASLTHFMWDFILMQFVAGFVAVVSINELSKRSQLIRTALCVFLAYAVTYTAIDIMQSGGIDHLQPRMFGLLGVNAVLLSFAYILIFVIEKAFGFVSRVTLVELSDINHPLLRELFEECPGTFQHSMAVSNIAAAAASRVGANVQLVRAGALYHDIGKISNPAFFTENQHGVNPHDALTPIQSARIVIGHVTDGVRRAEKAKLPARLRDFILEHHGKGTARFFYTTYCNAHPDENVDSAPFTYPGPNPQSLETSILMMADAVEAASRSLTDHSPESIRNLVDRIIDSQVNEGLHNDSPISFRDIRDIKKSFTDSLRTMYHSRISYPNAVKPTDSTPSRTD